MFKKGRCFYEHTQPLEVPTNDDDEAELRNPLFQKFFDEMTVLSEPDQEQEFWWMDEIENERIYRAICRMSLRRKMLIQLIYSNTSCICYYSVSKIRKKAL